MGPRTWNQTNLVKMRALSYEVSVCVLSFDWITNVMKLRYNTNADKGMELEMYQCNVFSKNFVNSFV